MASETVIRPITELQTVAERKKKKKKNEAEISTRAFPLESPSNKSVGRTNGSLIDRFHVTSSLSKTKTKGPPKFSSASGIRGDIFISVYNFTAQ